MDRSAFLRGDHLPHEAVPDGCETSRFAAPVQPAAKAAHVPGFTCGTRIKTLQGEVPAEALRPGDRVLTRDNGYQVLCWIGLFRPLTGAGASVRLRKGVMGRGVPDRGLRVSGEQLLLIGGDRLRDRLGLSEALVNATDLTCLPGISRQGRPDDPLVQLLFDRHELIHANGAWCASFWPTGPAISALSPSARRDLMIRCPELDRERCDCPAARPLLNRSEARRVLMPQGRHRSGRSGHA